MAFSSRMLKKAKKRVFAVAYRAATVRESVADGLFQHPKAEQI
jgi:hypothetical protein